MSAAPGTCRPKPFLEGPLKPLRRQNPRVHSAPVSGAGRQDAKSGTGTGPSRRSSESPWQLKLRRSSGPVSQALDAKGPSPATWNSGPKLQLKAPPRTSGSSPWRQVKAIQKLRREKAHLNGIVACRSESLRPQVLLRRSSCSHGARRSRLVLGPAGLCRGLIQGLQGLCGANAAGLPCEGQGLQMFADLQIHLKRKNWARVMARVAT